MSTQLVTPSAGRPEQGHEDSALPLRRTVRLGTWMTLIIAALTLIAAVAGILTPESFYPTADLQSTSVANDIMTLVVGLPVLLLAVSLAHRGRLLGLLLWPGALFYGVYNYIAYVYTMPLTMLWPVYLLIVVLSVYTMIGLVAAIDAAAVAERLRGHVPERFGGGALVLVAVLVIGLAVGPLIEGLSVGGAMERSAMGVAVADFMVAGAWLVGGLLLWRKQPLGYVGGAGLLFQGVMLFVGLVGLMLLQPLLGGEAFPLSEIGVVLLLGLPIYVPFVLFVRGIRRADRTATI